MVSACHKHTYVETERKEANCVESGYVIKTCQCGESFQEAINSFGHDYEEEALVVATCQHSGRSRFRCKRCGKEYEADVPIKEHDFSANNRCLWCGISQIIDCLDKGDYETAWSSARNMEEKVMILAEDMIADRLFMFSAEKEERELIFDAYIWICRDSFDECKTFTAFYGTGSVKGFSPSWYVLHWSNEKDWEYASGITSVKP